VVEAADDLVDAVVRVARERGSTYILMGSPTARRGVGRLGEPVAARLMRALPGVDVRLVAESSVSG
jgi:two-component system sensor histidine kinase KdpD